MSTSDLVVDAATTLARLYGKSYGALVASGQAAIELARKPLRDPSPARGTQTPAG